MVELGYIDTWNLTDISGVACSESSIFMESSWSNCSIFVIFLLVPLDQKKGVLNDFFKLRFFNGKVFSSKL